MKINVSIFSNSIILISIIHVIPYTAFNQQYYFKFFFLINNYLHCWGDSSSQTNIKNTAAVSKYGQIHNNTKKKKTN